MKRFLLSFSICLLFFVLCNSHDKPHLFTVVIDDLGWSDLGAYGAEYETPNIDNLITTESLRLDSYYTQATCTPTRSAFMTGRYPWKLGLQNPSTIPPGTTQHIPFKFKTIAEMLKKEGYSTHALGKWHLGYASNKMTPTGRGFDTFSGYFQGAGGYFNHTMCGGPDFGSCGFDWFENTEVDFKVNGTYSNNLIWEKMEKLLDEHDSDKSPMFGYFAYQTIHAPIEEPPNASPRCAHIKFKKRQIYCNKIQYLDDTMGKFIQKLKENGMWKDSLIVVTTDNGGMPNNVGKFTDGWLANGCGLNIPLRGGKVTTFEGGVRGMAFITGGKLPDELRGKVNKKGLFHSIDIAAGQLHAAKASVPKDIDGIDLFTHAFNEDEGHEMVFLQIIDYDMVAFESAQAIRWKDWKYTFGRNYYDGYWVNPEGPPNPAPQSCTRGCLFNITNDPRETTNLIGLFADIATRLHNEIKNARNSDDYFPQQDADFHNESLPASNGGAWKPFLPDSFLERLVHG